MDFGAANVCGPMFSLETMSGGSGSNPNRIIGVDITFTCPGTETIRRSFLRSEWHAVHLGREPADISGVANAFQRTDVVPPVMSRKHAEIMFNSETPQVMDIGSYHGTYFRASGQRLIVNKPYLLADGLVLEFGKSVTKDDKAHEPLLATIRFIHESDRDRARFLVTGREQVSSLLSAPSPPRRYSVPSDSDEDEDEDESDEDDETSSHSDVFEYTPQPTHIDLTTMSDDGKSSVGDDGDGIECIGFGFSRSGYEEESVSSSDMSESEYEEDVGKVVTPPSGAAAGPSSTHGLITPPVELVAPAPISLPRLPRIEAALSGLQEYHEIGFYPLGLPDFASRAMEDNSRASGSGLEWYIPSGEQVHQGPSQVQHGPSHEPSQVRREQVDQMEAPQHEATQAPVMSEEVRSLKADLEVAQNEITELKRSLAEKEKRDQDGDVTIVEAPVAEEATETPAADDLPTLITNIENMMGQLSTVGDDELRDHRRVVLQLLARLTTERETLWHRVGSPTISRAIANKRKREEDEEAEPRRAQSPLPATTPAPEPVSVPTPTPAPGPSPAKRLRVNPVVSALASGVVVWGALASGYL